MNRFPLEGLFNVVRISKVKVSISINGIYRRMGHVIYICATIRRKQTKKQSGEICQGLRVLKRSEGVAGKSLRGPSHKKVSVKPAARRSRGRSMQEILGSHWLELAPVLRWPSYKLFGAWGT